MRELKYADLGVVQKWVMVLLIALIFYDDTLYALKVKMYPQVYEICFSVLESTFIALMLFFWVLLVHSIAQTDQSFVLSPTAFYLPKIILCFGVWVYLVCVGVLS